MRVSSGHWGVDYRSRKSSREVLSSWLVLREVLSVLVYHSMKPLDWGRGRGSVVVNVLTLEELLKLIGSEGRAIVGVDSAGGQCLAITSWSF